MEIPSIRNTAKTLLYSVHHNNDELLYRILYDIPLDTLYYSGQNIISSTQRYVSTSQASNGLVETCIYS